MILLFKGLKAVNFNPKVPSTPNWGIVLPNFNKQII